MRYAVLAIIVTLAAPCMAQTRLLHPCERLGGVSVDTGRRSSDTLLVIGRAAEWVTEGAGSIRISTTSPEDATGNSYVSFDMSIEPTDFTDCALLFDAATSTPEQSKALYVRGYDEYGSCVLSFKDWSGPLATQMKTFAVYPGRSSQGLTWEPHEIDSDDRSAVVKLRFYVGTHDPGVNFSLYVDNVRISRDGPTLHSCENAEGASIDAGADLPEAALQVSGQARFVTEGAGSLHLSAASAGDADAGGSLCLRVPIRETDFTGDRLLVIDAGSARPEETRTLSVRGYDAQGQCVLSWSAAGGPLTDAMQSFRLRPGASPAGMSWEADDVGDREPVGVVSLQVCVGTDTAEAPLDLHVDAIRVGHANTAE